LGIRSFFVFDVDVLSANKQDLRSFSVDLHGRCVSLGKICPRKDPSNLQDTNLTDAEITEKNAIVDDFSTLGVYVLRDGALEQYLDEAGEELDETKGDELRRIFTVINQI